VIKGILKKEINKMTDIFRKEHKLLSDDQKAQIENIKNAAEVLYGCMESANFVNPNPRMMALAKTNLEQAVMWAVKAIT
jgi:hypothetical protein